MTIAVFLGSLLAAMALAVIRAAYHVGGDPEVGRERLPAQIRLRKQRVGAAEGEDGGVAVVRLSGDAVVQIATTLLGQLPAPRHARPMRSDATTCSASA